MVANKWITKIISHICHVQRYWLLYMFGDQNQCNLSKKVFKFTTTIYDQKVYNKYCVLKERRYNTLKNRVDTTTKHIMLTTFLKTGRISTYFEPVDKY